LPVLYRSFVTCLSRTAGITFDHSTIIRAEEGQAGYRGARERQEASEVRSEVELTQGKEMRAPTPVKNSDCREIG
jgi:hypothetical protein